MGTTVGTGVAVPKVKRPVGRPRKDGLPAGSVRKEGKAVEVGIATGSSTSTLTVPIGESISAPPGSGTGLVKTPAKRGRKKMTEAQKLARRMIKLSGAAVAAGAGASTSSTMGIGTTVMATNDSGGGEGMGVDTGGNVFPYSSVSCVCEE